MELRDSLNTKERYEELIDKKTGFIKEDYKEYQENNIVWDNDRVRVQFEDLIRYNYQVLISKYSLGLPVGDIVADYRQGVSFMEKGWKSESGYVEMLWYLSMGIMLEIEQEVFDKLIDCVKKDNPQDFLTDFLINAKSDTYGKQNSKLLWNTPYKALLEVIDLANQDKGKATIRLQKYLEKEWYRGHSDAGWYNDHKSKWGIHFGYWSFESGALVKILGLDDSILKDQQYYPYDMVHWKE